MKDLFTLFFIFTILHPSINAQCPYVTGAMINACGTNEGPNEFLTFNTGGNPLTATNFRFSYGSNTPPPFSGSATLFINGGAGGTVFAMNPGITLSGCSTIITVTASTVIPANSNVIMMYNSTTLTEFNLSAQCSSGTVYVMFINTANISAADGWSENGNFNNNLNSNESRYLNITNTASPCSGANNVVSYQGTATETWGSNTDGNAILWGENSMPDYVNGGCNAIAMPVTFSNFSVTANITNSIISFSTASETNNDYFTIERSAEARNFESIGEIKGAGNSSKEISYELTDERPLPGINYYRIKQTDNDGQYSYSEIRSVRHKGINNVSITPHTTEGRLDITTELEDYTIAIYNAAGQEVKRMAGMSLDQSISIETLHAGLYFVRINSRSENETVRIVKI